MKESIIEKQEVNVQQVAKHLFDTIRQKNISFPKWLYLSEIKEWIKDNFNCEVFSNQSSPYKNIYDGAIKKIKDSKYIFYNKVTKMYDLNIGKPELLEPIDTSQLEWDQHSMQTIFQSINDNKILIPDIQRPTAWTVEKNYIELAKSIFLWIPLGILYFWILDKEEANIVGQSYIKDEIISGKELHNKKATLSKMPESVKSVIDGQQRLTALNVIIQGTFNGKMMFFDETTPNKMFKFYINGKQPINAIQVNKIFSKLKTIYLACEVKRNEMKALNDKMGDEKMSDEELGNTISYELKEMLESSISKLSNEIYISFESLERIYKGIFSIQVLSICNISGASLEQITNIFIKVNENGKALKPIDLMLTYLVSKDNRKVIRGHVLSLEGSFKKIKNTIKYPTVMKLITMYFTGDSKSSYTTLMSCKRYDDQKEWAKLNEAVDKLGNLLDNNNFSGKEIHSANSLIPPILWLTNHKLSKTKYLEKQNILLYIRFAQTFKYFRAGTDAKLSKLWAALKDDDSFVKWKLDDFIVDHNEIRKKIENLNYNNDGEYIKNILKIAGTYMQTTDDTIEHILAQSKGGQHTIENLALLSTEDNSQLKDLPVDTKIEKLSKKYNLSKQGVIDKLMIFKNEDRIEKISIKLFNHFKDK